jgi:hypothetical protein
MALGEEMNEVELLRGEPRRAAVDERVAAPRIDGQRAELQRPVVRGVRELSGAADLRLHPRYDRAYFEWLGDVIIGPAFEAGHDVVGLAARGDEDDRRSGTRPDALAQDEAVAVGEQPVEQDDRERAAGQRCLGFTKRGHAGDDESGGAEGAPEGAA